MLAVLPVSETVSLAPFYPEYATPGSDALLHLQRLCKEFPDMHIGAVPYNTWPFAPIERNENGE
jgi:hypothetical protein